MKAPLRILILVSITISLFSGCATKRPKRGRSGLIEITQSYENKRTMSRGEAIGIIRECLQNPINPTRPAPNGHKQVFVSIDENGYVYTLMIIKGSPEYHGPQWGVWEPVEQIHVKFSEITKLLLLRVANQADPDKLIFLLRSSDVTPHRRPQVRILNRPSADVLSALLTLCPNVK